MTTVNTKIDMEGLDLTFSKKQIKVLKTVIVEQKQIDGCYNDKIDALVGLKDMCENILTQCGETPMNVSVRVFAKLNCIINKGFKAPHKGEV